MAHRALFERDLTKLANPGRTPNPAHNVAGHGDTLLITLPNLPPIEGDLLIYIVQSPPDATGNAPHPTEENIIGHFTAKLAAGTLSDTKGSAIPASFDKDLELMQVHVVGPGPDGSKGAGPSVTLTVFPTQQRIHTKYSLRLRTYALRDKAHPKQKKSWEFWDASASVWVHYHLAMVVPTGNLGVAAMTKLEQTYQVGDSEKRKLDPVTDVALNWLKIWAGQWKQFQPEFRDLVQAQTLACPKDVPGMTISSSDFANVVQKIGEAAKVAKHGIVALAVGHGDGSTAWFNLVPEDAIYIPVSDRNKKKEDQRKIFPSERVITHQDFVFLDLPGTTSHSAEVKKQVLNSLGPVFEAAPIRLFLLHTCNVGGAYPFLDRVAHEAQVYAAGHLDFITYSDPSFGPVQASYEKDANVVDEHNDAVDELNKADKRVAELEQELATAGPFDEQRIRAELEAERKKRDEAKERADRLAARLDALTHDWPLHRASFQAPPNPGTPPPPTDGP